MKALGFSLIAVGFLAGALVSVQTQQNEVPWALYGPALAVGIVGVALARAGARRATEADHAVTGGVSALTESLAQVVTHVQRLDAEKESIDPYEFHERIDATFPSDLERFVNAREAIAHVHGLPAYADVMGEFAAAERYLNRVWSASVDGYVDEVHRCLTLAREQFEETQRRLAKHTAGGGGPVA